MKTCNMCSHCKTYHTWNWYEDLNQSIEIEDFECTLNLQPEIFTQVFDTDPEYTPELWLAAAETCPSFSPKNSRS